MKPLLEKFLSSGEIEVLKIGDYEFALKKITTKQADFLNSYYDYFMKNPDEFYPFINSIVIEADKDKLKTFITKNGNIIKDNIRVIIHAICIQSLSLRPISLDYTFSNTVDYLFETASIMNRFINRLVYYGYKKSEIDEFSNNKIIRLALEEMYIRSKTECLLFIADFMSCVKKEYFPLSMKVMDKVKEKAEALIFDDPESRAMFLKEFYELLNESRTTQNNNTTVNNVKMKSTKDIRDEIREKEKAMFRNLPK